MLAISHHGLSSSIFICVYEKNESNSFNSHIILQNFTIKGTGEERVPICNSKNKSKNKNIPHKNNEKAVNLETIIEKLDEVIESAKKENFH